MNGRQTLSGADTVVETAILCNYGSAMGEDTNTQKGYCQIPVPEKIIQQIKIHKIHKEILGEILSVKSPGPARQHGMTT